MKKQNFLQRFRELSVNKSTIVSSTIGTHKITSPDDALDALTVISAIELYCKTLKEALRGAALGRAQELAQNGINVLPSGVKFAVRNVKKWDYSTDEEHTRLCRQIAELEQQRKNREKILQLQGMQPVEDSVSLAITLPE